MQCNVACNSLLYIAIFAVHLRKYGTKPLIQPSSDDGQISPLSLGWCLVHNGTINTLNGHMSMCLSAHAFWRKAMPSLENCRGKKGQNILIGSVKYKTGQGNALLVFIVFF